MSLDLRDICRLKVPVEMAAWLEGKSRESGDGVVDIVRDILRSHMEREIDALRISDQILRREGLPGILGEERG